MESIAESVPSVSSFLEFTVYTLVELDSKLIDQQIIINLHTA